MRTYSPAKCTRAYRRCRTIAVAMGSGAPTLSKIRRELGERFLEAYIKLWFVDLNELLQLKKPLTERQIDDMATRVADQYGSLNLADLTLVFERVKNGDTGQIYDRITIPTAMRWFRDYMEDRMSTAAERSYLEADKNKAAFSAVPRSSETRDGVAEATRKAAAWHRQNMPDKPSNQ